MKVYFRKLRATLARSLAPVYLITGDEPVQMRDAARMIRQRAKAEGFDRRELRIVERGFPWEDLPTVCGPSLFGDKTMLDLRLLGGKLDPTAKARLKEWCDKAPPDSLMTFQMPRLDNRGLNEAWAKAVDRVGVVVRIMPLDEQETRQWLRDALQRQGLSMSPQAEAFFLSRVEGNLLAAEQELQKLLTLEGPGELGLRQLQWLLGRDARYEAADLAMAMLQGRGRRIVEVARSLKSEGLEPVAVHALLMREVRQVLALQQRPSGLDSIYPFTRRNALRKALESYSGEHFRAILGRFVRLERIVKGQGPEGPWEALQDACLAFSGQDRLLPAQGED